MAPKLKDMIDTSEEYLKRQHDRWDNSIKLYKGEITRFRRTTVLPTWAHAIEVNLTKPTVDTMLPNLIYRTPKIMFRPGQEIAPPELVAQALQIENDINAIQLELNMSREYKKATKDALILGNGFVKYGMTDLYGYDEETYPFPAPFLSRVSPWEVGVDPACRESDLSDAEWIWFRNIVPLERARKDPLLKNTGKLKATSVLECLPKHVAEDSDQKKSYRAYEYVVLYELWSKDRNMVYVLDRDGNVFRDFEWPYELYGAFPVSHISFNHVPDEFYCMGEPEFLENLQLEISEKRTQWLNHTRRFNRKYRVPQEMSKDDVAALVQGDDGTVVRANNEIQPIEDAPLPGDISKEIDMIYYESREVTGISAYQRGGSEAGVYTATEANMINASSNIRVEERRMELADAVAQGAKILYNILRPSKGWPQIPFDFTVDITTMRRPDDEQKRADLLQFGQVAAPFPEFRRDGWLQDVAIAFQKAPQQYLYSPEEIQQMQQNQPPDPNQVKAQMEQQKMQMQMQIEQQKAQMELQQMQAELQMQQQKMQMELQQMQAELEMKREEMQMEREQMAYKHSAEVAKVNLDQQKAQMDLQATQAKTAAGLQATEAQTQAKVRAAKQMQATKPKKPAAKKKA
jgi:hypothetical protein